MLLFFLARLSRSTAKDLIGDARLILASEFHRIYLQDAFTARHVRKFIVISSTFILSSEAEEATAVTECGSKKKIPPCQTRKHVDRIYVFYQHTPAQSQRSRESVTFAAKFHFIFPPV